MAFTFDGSSKLIILSTGTTSVDVKDMYSRWKDWVVTDNNAKYPLAFSVIGGDPTPTGFLGSTFFLENNWRIRPYEGNHTLTIDGNLFDRGGASPFTSTVGSYNVLITVNNSNLVDTVSTGGGSAPTALQNASAVWASLLSDGSTTTKEQLEAVLTLAKFLALK